MSARRWADLAAKAAVPVLAAAVVGYVLVEPARPAPSQAAVRPAPRAEALAAAELVCPGPETIGVRGADADHPLDAPAAARVAAASSPSAVRSPDAAGRGGTVAIGVGKAGVRATRTADGAALAQTTSSAPSSLAVTGSDAAAPGLVAEQLTVVPSGDLRGLSSATCLPPADDQWLVGGGTDTGRRGRLVLSNPHESTADVTIDVLSAQGPVRRTPGSTVAVPPRSRVVLLLDALAPGAQSPVVHVRTTGGSVGAVLSDTWLDGTTPRGLDDVVASLPPAKRVVVPGVRLDGAATVRLAVPGQAEAVVQLRVLGQDGAADLPDGGVVRVPAGSSKDVSLAGVPDGAYGVEVVSDVPVVAGAMVQRRPDQSGPGELAWSATSDPVTSLTGLALADAASGWHTDLVLTAARDAAHVDVVTVGADGTSSTSQVDVPAGTTRVVAADGGQHLAAAAARQRRGGRGPLRAARRRGRADDHHRPVAAGAPDPGADRARAGRPVGAQPSSKRGSTSPGSSPSRCATCSTTTSCTIGASAVRSTARVSRGLR